jgi:hypothetical protein
MLEFIAVLIFVFITFSIIKALFKKPSEDSPVRASLKYFKGRMSNDTRDSTERWVEHELRRRLLKQGYVIFGDLIIPSVSKTISSTQIDHVIVSRFGIFCLETKSHQGNIYGNEMSENWKQYLGNKNYTFYSPLRQNKHHVRSLEYLLRSRLKSPIHSYIVFPSAHKVKINGQVVDLTLKNTIKKIENHRREVYTLEDVEAIAKGLAYVSTRSLEFRNGHIESVKEYIATKDSKKLVYSSKHVH